MVVVEDGVEGEEEEGGAELDAGKKDSIHEHDSRSDVDME